MISFFLPGGVVLVSLALVLKIDYLNNQFHRVTEIFPFIILLSSMLIGIVFKRSRLVLSVVVVLVGGFVLFEDYLNDQLNIYLLSFYFPINIFIIYNFHDRGIFKLSFMKYLGLFLVQAFIYIYIYKYQKVFMENVLSANTITDYMYSGLLLTKASLIVYLSVLVYLLSDFFIRKETSSKAFFWSLLTLLVMFYSGLSPDERFITVSTAGFILLISFLISSYDVAYKDKLTELPSRRSFDENISELGDSYSIGLVDIDFFKKFNDKYGHDIGDQVLKLVAARLDKVKGGGKAYRYGGEEFAIIFPGRGIEHSYNHLEELRKDVENQEFHVRGKKRPRKKPKIPVFLGKSKKEKITVSIGIAEKNDKLSDVHEVIKAADVALYKAKKEGRNRVCYK